MSRKVEIRASSHGGPPGASGQQTQRSTLWFRASGGKWARVGWTSSAAEAEIAIIKLLKSEDHPRQVLARARAALELYAFNARDCGDRPVVKLTVDEVIEILEDALR